MPTRLASIVNSGTISATVSANAVAGTANPVGTALAFAVLGGTGSNDAAIFQEADGSTVSLSNSGTIDFGVEAHATGGTVGFAFALGDAIDQLAVGSSALATIVNDGSITIDTTATATGAGFAGAVAISRGVGQSASGTVAAVSMTNAGTFSANAVASANAGGTAATGAIGFALASSIGVEQAANGATVSASFVNSGAFAVNASANVTATGTAAATTSRFIGGCFCTWCNSVA